MLEFWPQTGASAPAAIDGKKRLGTAPSMTDTDTSRQTTVLFADVARSMELAERVDPEEWHRLLDRLFREQVLSPGKPRACV